MADKKDLDFTYTAIDKIFRLSIGETGDLSGALYNGDFTMTLEQAQRAKHQFMVENLNIRKGTKVLDMGCGWGPFINYVNNYVGAETTGLTLSEGQARACRKNGLNVHVKDCRNIKPSDFGIFDSVVSVGAFEHFCSINEYKAGKQEEIYLNFFKSVYHLLSKGGRFFLQTMTFSKNMIDFDEIDINADKNTDSYIIASLIKEFPGSWPPSGLEMILSTSNPYFKLISQSSGRLDYIETIGQWRKKFRKFSLKKYWLYLSLIANHITDKEFRHRVAIFRISPNRVCFEREIMDHYRLVLEKI